MKANIIIFVLSIALIVLALFNFQSCGEGKQKDKMIKSVNDMLKQSRNDQHQQISTISILQGNVSDFKKIDSRKDSTIAHLQSLVDKHTISATVISNNTSAVISTKTDAVKENPKETITDSAGVKHEYPTYTCTDTSYGTIDEKKMMLSIFNIVANKDKFKIDYKVFNKFDITTRYNRPKWYKARVPEITVKNLNPNTETTELKNFTVSGPPNQKLYVFLSGGIAATIVNGIIVLAVRQLNPF